MTRVAVIGAGSWGTTVAGLAGQSTDTTLWCRRNELADIIQSTRYNTDYLPGFEIPENVSATADIGTAVEDVHAIVMAVPSHGFREVLVEIIPRIGDDVPIVSLTKGIEQDTLLTMTGVVMSVSPNTPADEVGVLTGPNLASEIALGQPTAAVVAMRNPETAQRLQAVFMSPTFRVYTNDDVVGCEMGGSLKNVMAIAAGMSDGLGFGDNTRAALITRALAELTRLGVALGGRAETFAGLAGMGDLVATCISPASRNHKVGFALARGQSLDNIVQEMNMVAEGVKTTQAVLDIAAKARIEMPIAQHVGQVLYEGLSPREAVLSLMTREARSE
jgi:glycerol-3-phosphate dehydrogenase (NAD(P)+)